MTRVTSEASLAPVAAFVLASAAICWWVMQGEPAERSESASICFLDTNGEKK